MHTSVSALVIRLGSFENVGIFDIMQPYFKQFAPISGGCAKLSWLLAVASQNELTARQQIPQKMLNFCK